MPRLSLKPDSSFFRKIAAGAVGARAVCADLAPYGHTFVELERGATQSKLWKDVKRKRVRIPDLMCLNCGIRIECRAKTDTSLSMSHSPTDAERAWDFGMVDTDWIAFPVCHPVTELDWTSGKLNEDRSYWREKRWVEWSVKGQINYFTVQAFRSHLHARSRIKGVEEGSENFIGWDATFSTRNGPVLTVDQRDGKITIARQDGTRPYTWRVKPGIEICVSPGDTVRENQVIASTVPPILKNGLTCSGEFSAEQHRKLLSSRERTLRFTGVKLARLRNEPQYELPAAELASDEEEDVYVRLEAASYLVACCGCSALELFTPYLESADQQTQLEAVIALGETRTSEAVGILSETLSNDRRPYFLRSAAAWSLGQIGSQQANANLVAAFASIDLTLRYEALDNLVAIGGPACNALLEGLRGADERVVAGCAEALRQQPHLPDGARRELMEGIRSPRPNKWIVWLIGNLPRDCFSVALADLQETAPELHYALSLLWSFVESWIARDWEVNTSVEPPH